MRFRTRPGLLPITLLAAAAAGCVPHLTVLDGSAGDASADADAARDGSTAFGVSFALPRADAYTNGSITLLLAVSGVPDGAQGLSVELLRDGQTLTTITSGPLQYVWDTRTVPEGRHAVVARATYRGMAAMSEVRTVTVDRSPPSVAMRVPAPGSDNVFLRDPVVVTFSEPVLESSITDASLALTYPDASGNPLRKTWSLSPDGMTLTITLAGDPPAGFFPTTIAGTLGSAITDLAGNGLAAAGGWTWQVPDWALVAQNIHASSGPGAYESDVATDPATGATVLAWTEGQQNFAPDDRLEVFVQRRVDGAWQPMGGAISALPATPRAQFPRLGISPLGMHHVSWIEPDAVDVDAGTVGSYRVHAARWNGSAWAELGAGVSATSSGVSDANPQAMAVDPAGDPAVAWVENDPSTGVTSVYAAHYDSSAGDWRMLGDPQRASTTSTAPQFPALAYSRAGDLYLAWSEQDGALRSVQVRQLVGGTTWVRLSANDSGLQPSPADGQVDSPSIAIGPNGEVLVAANYLGGGASAHAVYVAQWDPTAAAWTGLGTLEGDTAASTDTVFPHMTLDAAGQPWVAWAESVSGGGVMTFVQHRATDGTWSSVGVTGLSAQRPTPAQIELLPRIALDRSDHAVVTWTQENLQDPNVGAVYAAVQNY